MEWTWAITIASIIGTIANIYQKWWCFLIWLGTNAAWSIVDFSIGQYAQGALFLVYFLLAAWGLIKWIKKEFYK